LCLSSVTLKMLEVEFNLDYNEINSINKNFKPAKYIKTERLYLFFRRYVSEYPVFSDISDIVFFLQSVNIFFLSILGIRINSWNIKFKFYNQSRNSCSACF